MTKSRYVVRIRSSKFEQRNETITGICIRNRYDKNVENYRLIYVIGGFTTLKKYFLPKVNLFVYPIYISHQLSQNFDESYFDPLGS